MKKLLALIATALMAAEAFAYLVPAPHPLFDGDVIHTFELTFHQPSWWDSLEYNYENYDEPVYIAAEFDWDDVHLDSIGVRFKGNSSYHSYPGDKLPFKLDINEFVEGQDIDGLDKFSLNNCFKDPSFVREKCFWELAEYIGMPALHTNYVDLYLNGEYFGLYLLVEDMGNEFIESRFGSDEDGNLWKGDPRGDLIWRGGSESDYYAHYELATNEDENDWSGLLWLVDILNNTPADEMSDSLICSLELGSALGMLALNNLTVNLDSYTGSGHNHYFYLRDLDDRFTFTCWDANEAWGCFNMGLPIPVLRNLDPYYHGGGALSRPLCTQLWNQPDLAGVYEGLILKLMDGAGHPSVIIPRMEELRDLVRPSVYADTKKMYSNSQFESAMTTDIYGGPGGAAPGLQYFIQGRHSYLRSMLGDWNPVAGLVLNELMPKNNSTIADEYGEFDDWVEIANLGDASVSLLGYGLTDELGLASAYLFPDTTLAPGEYLVIWCDDAPEQGNLHAAFKLDGDGERVYLMEGYAIQDQTGWRDTPDDMSWGRWPNGDGAWQVLSAATPGAENENPEMPEEVVLHINEFVALNNTGIQDEMGSFEDWVEIWNPGPSEVEMGGLYLSDDLAQTTKWAFPDTVLPAGEFLVVWCDDDENDGPLHTNFKLGGSGEEIGLFGRLAAGNEAIDSYVFGQQTADVSEGRQSDGGNTWVFFEEPTPGASNGATASPAIPGADLVLFANHPNPFNPSTRLSFSLPAAGPVTLEIFDVNGRRVRRLLDEEVAAGLLSVDWDGRDDRGRSLASGLYLSRLRSGGKERGGRMLLLR